VQYYFQPETRKSLIRILGKVLYRTMGFAHMIILTDRELIHIQEEVRGPEREKYGGIKDFIPLEKIVSIELNEKKKDLLELSIRLPGEEHLELIYQPAAEKDIEQLVRKVREIPSLPEAHRENFSP